MKISKNKITLIILITILSISLIILVSYFLLNYKKDTIKNEVTEQKKELTEEEKMSLLNKLAQMGTTNLTKEEKIDTLEKLKNATTSSSENYEQEKLKILETLKNTN
jgi:flagellar basal body-associated protein FliL